ncbi:cadherin-1 [Astyanax mexicanus]|uniref:cadherin-1 n=1 Tax=Astyanax mexicanus TaxID=7994 RepID=UPI0020CAA69C|nr:cadherin-1 [Astyanax mexicanus]
MGFILCYMETLRSVRLGVLLLLLQVLSSSFAELTPCINGFDSEVFIFKVHRPHLHRGRKLGRVLFNDCAGRGYNIYSSTDQHFQVDVDGTVELKTQLTLHQVQEFSVHAWDSEGKRYTASVRVENHHHAQQEETKNMNINVLKLWRQKRRCMLIPPLSVPENQNVPFPKLIAVFKSDFAKETKTIYSMKGEGADEPPVGVFIIDKYNGSLYVTQPLDRETKDKYVLTVHAVAANGEVEEETTEIIIVVIDGNDNKPIFTQNPFLGSVAEASPRDFEFMVANATDADDPDSDHADIRYSIISQTPPQPDPNMFIINPITGGIRVNSDELDRETYPEYILLIQAADMMGDGLVTTGTAVITVTDINDHAPQFEKTLYTASVPENKVGSVVVKIPVTDGDDPQTPAWTANFRIFSGNSGGFFSISTGPNKQEGIITTVKPLDFEQTNKYTLLVITENDVPFAKPLPTSTATVIVNVQDVNEAPVFDPAENIISKPEDLEVGTELTVYTATDPDTARAQTVTYRVSNEDRSGWVSIDRDTGLIRVKSSMDRESPLVKDGKFKVLILAVDDDEVPATGTGTLVIELEDVNDNAPVIEEREITVCSKNSVPVSLSVTDEDGSGFAAPFTVELHEESRNNWTAGMDDSNTKILLTLKTAIQQGKYSVVLRVYDSSLHSQDSTIITTVCDCTGEDVWCSDREISGFGLSPILGILGASLALLILVLLLLLFLRKKRSVKKQPQIPLMSGMTSPLVL